jgi:hypothetical protein
MQKRGFCFRAADNPFQSGDFRTLPGGKIRAKIIYRR